MVRGFRQARHASVYCWRSSAYFYCAHVLVIFLRELLHELDAALLHRQRLQLCAAACGRAGGDTGGWGAARRRHDRHSGLLCSPAAPCSAQQAGWLASRTSKRHVRQPGAATHTCSRCMSCTVQHRAMPRSLPASSTPMPRNSAMRRTAAGRSSCRSS